MRLVAAALLALAAVPLAAAGPVPLAGDADAGLGYCVELYGFPPYYAIDREACRQAAADAVDLVFYLVLDLPACLAGPHPYYCIQL